MIQKFVQGLIVASVILISTGMAFGFGGIGTDLNNNCPNQPYTGDCTLCHAPGDFGANTPAKSAAGNGNWDFFCPVTDPNDVDDDGDGFTENQGDCNDNAASINPGATEICGDGIDQDCNGSDLACQPDPNDVDNDGDGVTENQGDCNDNNSSIFPGANEICGDGIDQDCNGSDLTCQPDPNDVDNDGDGVTENQGDCNDTDPAINPSAAERCTDGIDNNCDGLIDGQDTQACPAPPTCTDADQDGFFAQTGCNTAVDCNDNDAMVFPGATELCGDSIDNDCDGNVDENCDMGGNEDGPTLYELNCASCHQMLGNSDVCGDDAEDIMEAIAENEGGMSFLSSLSDDQIKSIAEALANCNQDDGEEEEDEEEEEEPKKKERKKKERRNDRDRDRDND